MADHLRFQHFARFLVDTFGVCRVFDVAGGMGKLNQELTALGCATTTFDRRHKRLPVTYAERDFTLEEPCEADLVVGLHADGATRVVIEYAAKHRLPFAVIPCCADNGMPYKPWMRHLTELAATLGYAPQESTLPMRGRARIIWAKAR
ncbi:MAG: hypothetical protein K1X89_02375 [Myxococcaceae bacterium]|nr:hypothetical protein [Myxococcaceae bacterium]